MNWTATISDGNGSDTTLTAETPIKAVKALMCHSINHDYTDIELYQACFDLIETIEYVAQDEYRMSGGDISERWHITLKPAAPEPQDTGWTVIDADHEFEDDCEKVEPVEPTIKVSIYGHVCECRLLEKHGTGTIDVERLSDGQCFRVSGLAMA